MPAATTQQFVRRVARSFLQHLDEELQKPAADQQVFDFRPARTINEEVLRDLRREFPDLEKEAPPGFHLFRRWFELNEFPMAYEDFSTEAYNIIFLERLRSLQDGSPEGLQRFLELVKEVFRKFDYRREGFSVSNFLKFENNMRELLRELLLEQGPEAEREVWPLVYEQSTRYQALVNEFFEDLLREAFAESERLLNNILPADISDELKKRGFVKPVYLESATVLFTDFKGFTMLSERMAPQELLNELDQCFSLFDEIIEQHGLEKIKTIGDSFMCAGGVPYPSLTHVFDAALVALAMRSQIERIREERAAEGREYWQVRIGLHCGPLVAGVIGKKKFSYDVWGDTVNLASRMESSGEPGRINVSEAAAAALRPLFVLADRGNVAAKNKGELRMFFLERLKPRFSEDEQGTRPNAEFAKVMEAVHSGKKLKMVHRPA